MTEIVNGELVYNELTKNANGGTELMARLLVDVVDPELLKGKQIVFSRVRELQPDLKKILYLHDLPNDPESNKIAESEFRNQFEKLVFVSHWQQNMYNLVAGVPFGKSFVIPNSIRAIKHEDKDFSGKLKLIYHTTPHRGLELLVPAFIELKKHFDVELDVFSSFNAYGWGERDEPYKQLFDLIDETDGINNHGFQPNEVVREYLKKAHIFAYPSIWTETSCIALIEAMAAGLFCVHSNLGALPETSRGLTTIYMFNENKNAHVNSFYTTLYNSVATLDRNRDNLNYFSRNMSNIAQSNYSVNNFKTDWERLLREV